jgi:ferredoxin
MTQQQLRVDPIGCHAHGLCAELFPEMIDLDEWGYPVIVAKPIPHRLRKHAERAVAACPTLALRIDSQKTASPNQQPRHTKVTR